MHMFRMFLLESYICNNHYIEVILLYGYVCNAKHNLIMIIERILLTASYLSFERIILLTFRASKSLKKTLGVQTSDVQKRQ